VNVWPAAVIVPVRAAPLLAATENPTVPLPVPEAPLEIVTQLAFDPAVHGQVDADAVTPNDPGPPTSATLWTVGEIENVHGGGGGGAAAACDTVNVLPAAVIVPLRAAPEFAATVNDTLPLPVPELPPETVIHAAFDAAVHAHVPADALTANDPEPPVSTTD
jgi:hypothetical protein